MELRYLRYFVAVAEELNFTRAAERLHIAQPPLSIQIRKLETELGVPLFVRSKRHVALTDAGRVLLGEARQLLTMADRAADETRSAAAGSAGRLAVGFVGSATTAYLPEVVKRYRLVQPRVALALYELTTAQQLDALHRRDILVGLLRPPVGDSKLAVEVVQREPLLVALPRSNPLVEHDVVAMRQLADQDFITFQRKLGPGLHSQIYDLCRKAGFVPRVVHEAGEMLTIVSLVSAGLGVALVPASMEPLFRTSVAYRRLDDNSDPVVELALAWREDNACKKVASFVEVARKVSRRGSAEQSLERQLTAEAELVGSTR